MPTADENGKSPAEEVKLSAELRLQLQQVETDAAKGANALLPEKKLLWWGIAGAVIFGILWLLTKVL